MLKKLEKRLRRLIREEVQEVTKANPIMAYTYSDGNSGKPLPLLSDPDMIARSSSINVWAYVSINTIGKTLSEAPLVVEQSKVVDGEIQWKPMEAGRLYELTQRPNEYESMDALLWRLSMSLMTGDAYVIEDPDTGNLYHVPVGLTRIVVTDNGISHYEITKSNKTTRVELDQMIHFTMPSPFHEYYGLSPAEPIKSNLLMNHYYNQMLKNFFKKGGMPLGYLTTDQQVDDRLADQSRKRWSESYGGENMLNQIAVLGGGTKYESIMPPLKDLVVDTLTSMPREAILAAFGMPPALAGIYEYANYANSTQQIRIYWQNTILPVHRILSTGFNQRLVPKYGESVRLRFDTSKIVALQEDELTRSQRLTGYVSGGIMTPNEARKQIGLEPIDDGDALRTQQSFNLSALGGNTGNAGTKSLHFLGRAEPRVIRLDMHIKRITANEKQVENFMREFFDGQANRVLDNLRSMSTSAGRIITAMLYAKISSKGDGGDVFDLEAENALLREGVEPVIIEVVRNAGNSAAEGIITDFVFDLKDPLVVKMINELTNRIVGINSTSYEVVQQILTQVYEEGLGLNEAVNLLTDKFGEFSKARARLIAITETNGAVSGAHQLAWDDMGIERKEWLTAPAVHPRHELIPGLDGQIVKIHERFDVGGEMLMHPGDPAGSPGNICNCHCGMSPVVA